MAIKWAIRWPIPTHLTNPAKLLDSQTHTTWAYHPQPAKRAPWWPRVCLPGGHFANGIWEMGLPQLPRKKTAEAGCDCTRLRVEKSVRVGKKVCVLWFLWDICRSFEPQLGFVDSEIFTRLVTWSIWFCGSLSSNGMFGCVWSGSIMIIINLLFGKLSLEEPVGSRHVLKSAARELLLTTESALAPIQMHDSSQKIEGCSAMDGDWECCSHRWLGLASWNFHEFSWNLQSYIVYIETNLLAAGAQLHSSQPPAIMRSVDPLLSILHITIY